MSLNKTAIKLIKYYQNHKGPNTTGRCVHYPTCSNYGIECYEKFNFFKASFLTTKRILLCTPLNKKFYDPVPLTKEEKIRNKELDKQVEYIIPLLKEQYDYNNNSTIEDYLIILQKICFKDSDIDYQTYYHMLNILIKQIKKKVIPLKPKPSIKYIQEHLFNGCPVLIRDHNV